MTDYSPELLDAVFGEGPSSASPTARARGSAKRFVRSIDQLVEDRPKAAGRRLTASEALEAYGLETLIEVAYEGSALLAASRDAAGRVLRRRRDQLGLAPKHLATRAKVDPSLVEAAENSRRLPIREYEKVARALGLDERFLSVRAEPQGNEGVAVRLRTLKDERPQMTNTAVSALSEASWVALTQVRLEKALDLRPAGAGLDYNPSYGTPDFPAHAWGYFLARQARERLLLGDDPIPSLRDLAEKRLGVPIIQTQLGETIAGATVDADGARAIVVNIAGLNREAPFRRATIAHELEHILFDPPEQLSSLRVDDYDEIDEVGVGYDPVEKRANAFAAELLIPQKVAVEIYQSSQDPIGLIMEDFGVSFSIARYQLWNGINRSVPLESLTTSRRRGVSSFEAAESFTVDYHPLGKIRSSRAGRFSAVAIRAAEEGIVSWDSAASMLEMPEGEIRAGVEGVRDLFPEVWGARPPA